MTMAFKIIKCPWCGKEARITYEENRVYQMKCYSCRNTMLHVDHSFDSAVDFFEHHANLILAEKSGQLVVLPCKVGDHVWANGREAIVVWFFGYKTERYLHAQFLDNAEYTDIPFYEISKTVFMSREEAEAALSSENTIPCKYGVSRHLNELGEEEVYCELNARWMNVSLGDCLGNCESETSLKGGDG